jgi:hypothetical protein
LGRIQGTQIPKNAFQSIYNKREEMYLEKTKKTMEIFNPQRAADLNLERKGLHRVM